MKRLRVYLGNTLFVRGFSSASTWPASAGLLLPDTTAQSTAQIDGRRRLTTRSHRIAPSPGVVSTPQHRLPLESTAARMASKSWPGKKSTLPPPIVDTTCPVA
jgi:hypothetical protein